MFKLDRTTNARRRASTAPVAAVWLMSVVPLVVAADEPTAPLRAARKLFLSGKYAEADEAYAALVEKHPLAATLGRARSSAAVGKDEEAASLLAAALTDVAKAADAKPSTVAKLHAEQARLAFDHGDHGMAVKGATAALALDPQCLHARWLQAELHRTAGRLGEADGAYKWFVDYYNATDTFADPDDLRYVGLAAAQYARWNRLSDQFEFLVNDLFPSALQQDAAYWPAHYEAGLLFLEKYNEAEAAKSLQAALALNPQAAEVHAALARLALQNFNLDAARRSVRRALEVDPQLQAARQAEADIRLANFDAVEAIRLLEAARKLNPVDEATLGRLAAAYAVVDGWVDAAEKSDRFKRLVAEVEARNPHAGEFYFALAQTFDQVRRFPAAAKYYRLAAERMPQLTTVRGELGLVAMRLGDEVEARRLLDESFAVDPFNVRVSNMRKVLDVLNEYAVLETPHFIIRFDRGRDELLAKYAARYLEEQVYPELTKQYGFEPEGKSLFEIFNRSRNTDGHGWFSARMVGLPYVGTVGACAGKMVALASPNGMDEPFNWARVLKHEFVHVLNLQQTNFNIPHWFTEALAVESEGSPRSEVWNRLLAERVPKGELFNLDTINLGFIRPKSSLDWQLAYCQSQLYAQYMLKTYGADALAKMLEAYHDNLDTPAALRRSFDVEQADFERGYSDFVKSIAQGLSSVAPDDEMSLAELVRRHREEPNDADAAARLGAAFLARNDYAQARKSAAAALSTTPRHQKASYVLARIRMVVGEEEAALDLLNGALDRQAPDVDLLTLLASLRFKAGEYDEAERLYTLGAEKFPYDVKWRKALAKTYLVTKNEARLAGALESLAAADPDDLLVRKKLAQLALARGDFASARRWAEEALFCDVQDVEAHRMFGEALAADGRAAEAVAEFEAAVTLEADDPELWAGLVRSAKAAKNDEAARRASERLRKLDPDHAALK